MNNDATPPNPAETARHSYDAARAEILLRMRLRDNVLLVFLAASGAFLGIGLQSNQNEVLLAIPFLALGTAILVSQHNMLAAALGQFLAHELGPFLKNLNERAPHWDNSVTFRSIHNTAAWFRFWGHMLVIEIPSIVGLCLNARHALESPFPHGPLWWGGAFCAAGALGVLWWSHQKRLKLGEDREWPAASPA
jgi:hypothetical protein